MAAGVKARRPARTYLLAGLLRCECGSKMVGDALRMRNDEYIYYRCRSCNAPRVPAVDNERVVLEQIKPLAVPGGVLGRNRASDDAPREPAMLVALMDERLTRLKTLYGWSELAEDEYWARRNDIVAQLAALSGVTKESVVLGRALLTGSAKQIKVAVRLYVESVTAHSGKISPESITWHPEIRPYA